MDRTDHRDVTFLGIFTHRFTDHLNDLLPIQRTILQSITFGLIIPDKITKIMRASANHKSVMQEKQFSGFELIRVHDQNTF